METSETHRISHEEIRKYAGQYVAVMNEKARLRVSVQTATLSFMMSFLMACAIMLLSTSKS